jgi:hypothetical protein
MSSGWLPKHRQLFFQIFQEGPNPENSFHIRVSSPKSADLVIRETMSKKTSFGSEGWFKLILLKRLKTRRQPQTSG